MMTENQDDREQAESSTAEESSGASCETEASGASSAPEEPTVCDQTPEEKLQELKDKAREAFRSGSSDAREAFDKAFPKAKEDFTKGIHDTSYALGYAISFGATLIKELTPDNVSAGFDEGTRAGSKAAEEVIAHRRSQEANSRESGDQAQSQEQSRTSSPETSSPEPPEESGETPPASN